MVTEPTTGYGLAVMAITLLALIWRDTIRPSKSSQIEPKQTISLVLPEPPRPIKLLSAVDVLPIAPPIQEPGIAQIEQIEQIEQYERVADTSQSMNAIAGLLAATQNRPVTDAADPMPTAPMPTAPMPTAPVPTAPAPPLLSLPKPRLYHPPTLHVTTKMVPVKETEIEQCVGVAASDRSMTAIAGLIAAIENRLVTDAAGSVPAAPVPRLLPLPVTRLSLPQQAVRTIRSSFTIPSPWEPDSDRYWDQNNTATYPNIDPAAAGSCM